MMASSSLTTLLSSLAIFCISLVLFVSPVHAQSLETCPSNITGSLTVAPGCICNPISGVNFGMCRKGYVCAESWGGNLVRQALSKAPGTYISDSNKTASKSGSSGNSDATNGGYPSIFTCQSCSYGQYCPEGSVLPPTSSPLIQLALSKLDCPAGKYCPTPGEVYACTSGSFCSQSTVQPVTCNISTLVDRYPVMTMPTTPTTVYESVYLRGTALAGNQCPANSSNPTQPCEAGFYCPTPNQKFLCPEGYYCKEGSQEASKCPALAYCPAGSDKAALSWVGFILLAAVLVVLWMSYLLMIAALRVSQRRLARTQLARERLWKLLTPLLASQHHSKIQSFRAFKAIRPKITLEFENLGLTLHDGTPILSGVSGSFTHSRVAAIMGPSGAGKSTFLNVIMGKAAGLGKVSGKMKANKREMRPDALRGIVGFVPQEDIVHEDLTVRENLVYSARLRLSATKPLKEQLAIVDDVINVLQLRHVQHQVVGTAERRGISGGQRKRVNIGMELVAKPSILFMDEPTSGLDATAAADILGALKRMAGLGMNIITVIHQPRYSIFSLFDDVMLLCKGGRLAYLGPSRLALPYLESAGFQLPPNENPADFALDVLSGSVPRLGFPAFQPEDLVPLWQKYGAGWVDQQEAARASLPTGEGSSIRVAAEAVDPEQLRLLEQGFDQVDGDGDSAINGGELQTMLVKLGVEPTSADVQMIVTELADAQSGLISKHAFLQYVRYGGRPPTSDPSEQQGEAQRRVDSLYRVYSIEQYSLGSALAEIAAAQLPEGLKVGPNGGTSSLKNMATAANVDQQPSSTMMKQSTRSTATTGIAPASKSASVDVSTRPPTIPEGKESISSEETATTMRTSSNGSVASLQLPPSSQDHIKRNSLMPDMHRDSMVITDMGDVPIQHSLRWKFMWLLGLEAGGGTLRNTPGTFRQLLVLFSRASIKWTRNWAVKFMDILMLIVAAVICGGMHGTGSTPNDVRGHAALIMLTLGVLSATTSLSVFGKDRLIFWRERSSGIAVLSYFLANTALSLIDVALQPLVFLSIYQSMTLPTLPFAMHYLIGMLVVWWTSSAGCLISILAGQQATALIASVTVVLVTGGFINGVNPNYRQLSTTTKAMTALSYNRWAVEAITIASYKYYPEYLWPVTKALVNFAGYCGLDEAGIPVVQAGALKGSVSSTSDVVLKQQNINVYCKGYLANALVVLAMEGLVLRLVTLLALYICPRGVTLEPLAVALGSVFAKMKLLMRTRTKRRTATGNGVVGGV